MSGNHAIIWSTQPFAQMWTDNTLEMLQHKMNLCAFLADTWCDIGVDNLVEGQQLVIGGGFKNAQKSVLVKGHCEDRQTDRIFY